MSPRVSGPLKITRLPEKRPNYQGGGGGGVLGHKLERVRRVIDFEICDLKSSWAFCLVSFWGIKDSENDILRRYVLSLWTSLRILSF